MVLWLEEQKIRRYSVASGERNDLRNFESKQWQQYFDKYVTDLKCPASSQENNVQALCWILGYTLRLEAKHGSERASDIPMTFLDNIDSKLYYMKMFYKRQKIHIYTHTNMVNPGIDGYDISNCINHVFYKIA